jgi:GDP-4-dehydro-6-deoxy-D-mannose reductase
MRVLVTGASGFVGRHLAARLAGRGDHVTGIGTETAGPAGIAAWCRADLRAPDALIGAVADARPDAVVHLAAQSSSAESFQDPGGTFEVNTLGTWHLLEAVARAAPRARVLMAGTSEAYGPQPVGSRVPEETPFRPVSPYALSKAAADYACELAHQRHGLDVIRTRSFGHSGPGQSPRFFLPSCARQVAEIEKRGSDPVLRVGDLSIVRDLCDVRDVVEAYLALLERGRAGASYNVCRGVGVRLSDLVEGLKTRARIPIQIEVDPARLRPIDVPYLVGDPSRIERETGWQARVPLEQMLDDVLAEWRGRVSGA